MSLRRGAEQAATTSTVSGWLRNSLKSFSVPLAKRSLSEFFRGHNHEPKPKSLPTVVVKELEEFTKGLPRSSRFEDVQDDCFTAALPVCSQPASFSFDLDITTKPVFKAQKRKTSIFQAIEEMSTQPEPVQVPRAPTKITTPSESPSTRPFSISRLVQQKLTIKPVVLNQQPAPKAVLKTIISQSQNPNNQVPTSHSFRIHKKNHSS